MLDSEGATKFTKIVLISGNLLVSHHIVRADVRADEFSELEQLQLPWCSMITISNSNCYQLFLFYLVSHKKINTTVLLWSFD